MKLDQYDKSDSHAPFNVPDGYFIGLKQKIHRRISQESSPLNDSFLSELNTSPFQVPEQYFSDIHERINIKKNALPVEGGIKRQSIILRLIHNPFIQGAVAACFILCVGFWGYLRYAHPTNQNTAKADTEIYIGKDSDIDASMFDEDELIDTYLSSINEENKETKEKVSDDYLIENVDENLLLDEI